MHIQNMVGYLRWDFPQKYFNSLFKTRSFQRTLPLLFLFRYQILSESTIPSGWINWKESSTKLVEALQLDQSEYRVGLTKVFFRAGIVGELNDMRDERLSKIISQFQAYCKSHLMCIEYKKMCDQR